MREREGRENGRKREKKKERKKGCGGRVGKDRLKKLT